MKITATLALLVGLAGAGAPAAPATPSADEILERNFAALGGKDRIRSLRTLSFEGTDQAGGKSVPVRVYWKRPDRLRIEAPEQGLDKVQAFDGESAWSTYPGLPGFRPEKLPSAARDALRDQADLVEGPTFDYAAKGNKVELLGKEKLADGEAWRLQLTLANGEVRMLWFDCASELQVREERSQTQGDRVLTTESALSDFRPAGGILFAHRVETRFRVAIGGAPAAFGEPSVFTIEKIATDSELPDSLFAFPLPVAPAPAAASASPH